MIDFTPTEEQEALKTMVREFVEREVKPKAPAYDAEPDPSKGIPWDIIEEGNKLGLKDLAVNAELGGGGQDSLTLGMLVEELAGSLDGCGQHVLVAGLDGRGSKGVALINGMTYFYRLQSSGYVQTKKLMVLK